MTYTSILRLILFYTPLTFHQGVLLKLFILTYDTNFIIVIYHKVNVSIDFLCKQGSNSRSFIRQQNILSSELTRTYKSVFF